MRPSPRLALAAGALALLPACASDRLVMDPTLLVQSPLGTELGVSTNYGIVFLGSRARAGEIEVTAWFGDGASVESTVVEPIGGGLFTAEIDILLPWVPLAFDAPAPGDDVVVVGRVGGERWEESVPLVAHASVSGLLLPRVPELVEERSQVGAGVFVEVRGERRLLGLVSGRLELLIDGQEREFLTVVGPGQLWRLVTHRREEPFERRWVYRDDVL